LKDFLPLILPFLAGPIVNSPIGDKVALLIVKSESGLIYKNEPVVSIDICIIKHGRCELIN
jgi:hypothetical protein